MTAIPARKGSEYRAVRIWLLVLAGLIAAMVLVGGATRLTESGLSIVEWKPVTGAVPPLTEAQWRQAFEAYQAIPQYRQLNAGMSLSAFKTIFWWEWSSRPSSGGNGAIGCSAGSSARSICCRFCFFSGAVA
jgi:cytochrome c oxidase assembly protein subunit 15